MNTQGIYYLLHTFLSILFWYNSSNTKAAAEHTVGDFLFPFVSLRSFFFFLRFFSLNYFARWTSFSVFFGVSVFPAFCFPFSTIFIYIFIFFIFHLSPKHDLFMGLHAMAPNPLNTVYGTVIRECTYFPL